MALLFIPKNREAKVGELAEDFCLFLDYFWPPDAINKAVIL
jgi:hypothetical protein